MLKGHKFIYDKITFNCELGNKSALLACRRAFKSALFAQLQGKRLTGAE